MMVKRKKQAGYTVVELLICLVVLIILGLLGGTVYALIHFLLKVW